MRIVIDLQGAQAENRFRGIGRYSLSFARAIARNRGEHEVHLALNGLFSETIEPIRASFDGLLPQENIHIWYIPGPVCQREPANAWRREAAETIREAFLASLQPDMVLVPSLFEGLVDDAVTSIGRHSKIIPTAVTLHDLIPFIYQEPYLENPAIKSWYLKKIDHLRRADILLAISNSTANDAVNYLGIPEDSIVNASEDTDSHFSLREISAEEELSLRKKYGITCPFILYTSGIDYRKNNERLIRAFALLPKDIRRSHQLVIVCSIQPDSKSMLEKLARQHGLDADEVILAGHVPEQDLVLLYNLCKLFVFPSIYEGFGLPVVEAMRCGAPVIGANTSSLPEVIGRDDALFDPYSEDAIAAKITQGLTDPAFRDDLIRHGTDHARKFSWDESAKKAIAAFEQFHAKRQQNQNRDLLPARRPKLAYVSPLPPAHSGIADYSAELLPELAVYYDIEVITAQPEVSDQWIKACLPIRSVEWFVKHARGYDRVIYHFGNSAYHVHMFELLERFPGLVVLHDFFLSGIQEHREIYNLAPNAWTRALYGSHGYAAVRERFHARDRTGVVFKYPCNFDVLRQAVGVIVHSAYSVRLASKWYGNELGHDWSVILHLRIPARDIDKRKARKDLGLGPDDFIICSFGLLGPAKQNHRLIHAWLNCSLAKDPHCKLIFVGENDNGDYSRRIIDAIRQSNMGDRIRITGWADTAAFQNYLGAADLAVQLRTLSRGETSGTVIDCMNHGLATIVNANGSNAELPQDAVWILRDEFEDSELINSMETLRHDDNRRRTLGARAREEILTHHAPRICALQYAQAIESSYASGRMNRRILIDELARLDNTSVVDGDIIALASAIAQNLPNERPSRQLLVDISELVQRDVKSGIQRVTRSILKELLCNPPDGFRVEPVYATEDHLGYLYARKFALAFLECPTAVLDDAPIEAYPGDIFLGLDLQPLVVPKQLDYLKSLHNRNVQIYFVVHDLLPITLPEAFGKGDDVKHATWLNAVASFDGALCVSQTIGDTLKEWLDSNGPKRLRPFKIGWFHHGADVENSVPTHGLPENARQVLDLLSASPSFLMVGTIEPRKCHAQTLAAFEQIWLQGANVNLVIVGNQGWMVDELLRDIRSHPELGHRLFWLEGISDEYLERVYDASVCLIAASEGEGFGLPLIEAAQHRQAIIARDIPVFHEVAGEHAYYFSGRDPGDLAAAVQEWLALYQSGKHPKSDGMPWQTWKQSTRQLLNVILNDQWYIEWMPLGG